MVVDAVARTIGVTVSSARTRLNVFTQPSLNAPAFAVSQVQSGSFQSSHPLMLVVPVAASRAFTIVSTMLFQSSQLTHRYGKSG